MHTIFYQRKKSGFRKNRSCTTAVLKITEDIRLKMDRCNITLLTLLDFSKAFDTVKHEILLTKLSRLYMFSTSATSSMKSYLTQRYIKSIYFIECNVIFRHSC